MKKYLVALSLLSLFTAPAFAETKTPAKESSVATQSTLSGMQEEWARIKYQVPGKEAKVERIIKLEGQIAQYDAANPASAEAKLWHGIILATHAGFVRNLSVLSKVEQAKTLFDASIKQDSKVSEGLAYTFLGILYYQAPGWPISFGDNKLAEQNLKKGLQLNPNGIDANYFYGDFLLQEDRYDEAKAYLERAANASERKGWKIADDGRRQEARADLATLGGKQKSKPAPRGMN